jgi:hypothetical protein
MKNLGSPIRGFGPLGLETAVVGAQSLTVFDAVLSAAIGLITVIGGIWFMFLIITGGVSWMSAGGDKAKVTEAQQRLSMGVVGLIIVIGGMYLADLIGYLLGVNILNPGETIIRIMAIIGP